MFCSGSTYFYNEFKIPKPLIIFYKQELSLSCFESFYTAGNRCGDSQLNIRQSSGNLVEDGRKD